MNTLAIILARAGSKGLPGKALAELSGEPMIVRTIRHAQAAKRITHVVVSTDGPEIAKTVQSHGVRVIDRPAELATDTAPVADAARHAVLAEETHQGLMYDAVVILYANVPHRPMDLIDRGLALFESSGCDSVQSVCPVGKHHPYWMKTLDAEGRMAPFVANTVHRRQDLPRVYGLDGGLLIVRRSMLVEADSSMPHAMLGEDRRAVMTAPGSVMDVDVAADLSIAQAMARPTPAAPFVLAGRTVGGAEPFVIAEIGVNHDGQVNRALELVDAAAESGADAVKVQLFHPDRLLSVDAELAAYQRDRGARHPRELLAALQLDIDALRRVRDRAAQCGIGFLVTPFSPGDVSELQSLEPDAVKIASPDSVNPPLDAAALKAGCPMIISVGTTDRPSDRAALDEVIAMARRAGPLVLLQCVSAYPVPPGQAALGRIQQLRERYGVIAGYSDHTTGSMTGALAVAAGAAVIEKHLTYDVMASGPDHAASFDPDMFAKYVRSVHVAARELSAIEDGAEADVRRVSRQSVCAVRDLPAGHRLIREDLTVKRPGTGVPAARFEAVIGCVLRRAVSADRLLHEEDVLW